MRSVYEETIDSACKIEGRIAAGADIFVRSVIGDICKIIWRGKKPDVEVGLICGCDPRTARRYMSGELPAPPKLIHAIDHALIYGIKE